MAAVLQKQSSASRWCGILVLCCAICVQLLGISGTMFNVSDVQDPFQASVLVGFTMASGTPSLLASLGSSSAFTLTLSLHSILRTYTFFHPPLLS